jgi:hypothetical protein
MAIFFFRENIAVESLVQISAQFVIKIVLYNLNLGVIKGILHYYEQYNHSMV